MLRYLQIWDFGKKQNKKQDKNKMHGKVIEPSYRDEANGRALLLQRGVSPVSRLIALLTSS